MSQTPSPKSSPKSSPLAETRLPMPLEDVQITEQTKSPASLEKLRSISFAGPNTDRSPPLLGPRRLSIQFAPPAPKATTIKIPETTPEVAERRGSRFSSPPPPSTYVTRTSFDTFNNPAVSDPSFTLVSKHAGYTYSRHQRVFLVAVDVNDYSDFALKWLVESMVEDGDEVICLRVVERDEKATKEPPTSLHHSYKKDAKRLLEHIQATNDKADNKAISIILEFAIGNVEETIQRMIAIYSPSFLTVGTRGRSLAGIQGLLPGSVSKWCMQNSPVPVVMVRHPEKRRKKMQKRMKDPNRRGYSTILDQSASTDNKAVKAEHRVVEGSEMEAEAVAKAIGLSGRLGNWKGFKRDGSEAGSIKSEAEGDGEYSKESEPDTPSPTEPVFVDGPGLEGTPNYISGRGDEGEDPDDIDRLERVPARQKTVEGEDTIEGAPQENDDVS